MLEHVYQEIGRLMNAELPEWKSLPKKKRDNLALVTEAVKNIYLKNPCNFKALVYDIELANDPTKIGWRSYDKLEISCVGTYDYVENVYRIWQPSELKELIDFMHSFKMVIGFNNVSFDDNVMKARGFQPTKVKIFDILREMYKACGLDPDHTSPLTHGGFNLDRTSTLTLGSHKTGHGAHAMQLWEEGKYGELHSYCMNDVRLTKKLMDRIMRGEPVVSGKPQRVLNIPFSHDIFLNGAKQESLF